ncbi:hypothetical protein ACOCJ7_08335 [Knoellia sp. CPCC 206453]|uniref:hypothetical protein n=1 Tax=Knoellia pratensis TaxID=3404796 RepID=UPI00360CA0AE
MSAPQTVFVGGPIQYARLPGASHFDLRLRALLDGVHDVLRDAGHEVTSAHVAEDYGDGVVPTPDHVTTRDFTFARDCDVYVACLPMSDGRPYRSDGTHIELGWMSARGARCVIMWDREHADAYSFLVQGLPSVSPVVFVDLDDFFADPAILLGAIGDAAGRSAADLVTANAE